MKNLFLIVSIIILSFLGLELNAQCGFLNKQENGSTYYPKVANQTVGIGEAAYLRFAVKNGGTAYHFETCGSSYDTQLTGYNSGATGTSVLYNDDACGAQSSVDWTASFQGTLLVQNSEYNCNNWQGGFGSATLTYRCTAPTSPSVGTAGNGTWNVYCYDAGDSGGGSGAWSNEYSGYYTNSNLNFNTQTHWGTGGTPYDASTYKGCYVGSDSHSWRAIRTGFSCATYRIDIGSHDDRGEILVNGSSVWNHTGCCDTHSDVWTGVLSSSDVVEFRVSEGGGGSHGALTINNVTSTLNAGSINYSGSTTICDSYNPPAFGNSALASGSSSAAITNGSSTYQWQLNGSDISGANGLTYDPPAITSTSTYRRKVTDKCGNVAYTNSYTITINATPGMPTIAQAGVPCSGTWTLFVTSGAGGTVYFQGTTSNGTSTAIPSTSEIITSPGIYYFRGNNGGCWGPQIAVDVTPYFIPAATTASGGGTFCDNTTITAAGGTGGTIYFQGTTSNGTSTATASASETITSSGTYYFRSRTSQGCWGAQGSVSVTVNSTPAVTTVSGGGTFCDNTTITAAGGTGGTIYFQGTTSNGTSTATASTSETITSSGTYYFRSLNAGCWGAQGSVSVTINPNASATSVSGGGTFCDNTTITASGGSGGTIYFQGTTSNGTSTATASVSQSVTSSGTYYFRSRTGAGCWGAQGSVVVAIDVAPTAANNTTTTTTICEGSTKALTGSGSWSVVSGAGTISGSTYSTGSIAADENVTIRLTVAANGTCPATTDDVEFTVENNSEAATSASSTPSFVCSGDAVTISIVGGSLGTGATWEWYSDAGFTTSVGSGSPLIVNPTATTTYYVRAEDPCGNNTAGVNTVEVFVNGSSTAPSLETLAPASSSSTCVVNDNNWHHFYDASGDLLASINSNNENLGSVTVSIGVGNAGPFGTGLAPGVCGYPGALGGEYVMARDWDISVTTQPTNPVDVKFYFKSSEVSDLTTTISNLSNSSNYINCWGNVSSEGDLMMTVNHGGSLETPPISFAAGPGTGLREVSFQLSEFSSGKLHSNGGIHGANPLPVELLSFEAKVIDNEYIQLDWSTATEINNDGFELLRSTDGTSFEKIAWIKGNENSNQKQTYTYDDVKVSNGTYYYKLRQIDFDGESEDFDVISAMLDSKFESTEIVVRPIPSSNTITLDIESMNTSSSVISVYNFSGQKVLELNKEIFEGKNSLKIEEVTQLSSGIYYINLMVDDRVFTKKFVISK